MAPPRFVSDVSVFAAVVAVFVVEAVFCATSRNNDLPAVPPFTPEERDALLRFEALSLLYAVLGFGVLAMVAVYRWRMAQYHAYQERYWRELSETGDGAPEDLASWRERSEWHGKLSRRYRADILMFWREVSHPLKPESADDEP